VAAGPAAWHRRHVVHGDADDGGEPAKDVGPVARPPEVGDLVPLFVLVGEGGIAPVREEPQSLRLRDDAEGIGDATEDLAKSKVELSCSS